MSEPTEDIIEAVARAIYGSMGFAYASRTIGAHGPYGAWREAIAHAQAAITAYEAARGDVVVKAYPTEQMRSRMLDWRALDEDCVCEECGGSGVATYSSTATWRGGIGGQAMTTGVCDKCWGSGDKHRPWPSHRAMIAASQGKR